MNKFALIMLGLMAVILGGCSQTSQEATPDLATSLAGQFNATYLIVDPTSQQSPSSGSLSLVQLKRKNNNTLTIEVKIDDGPVQVNDRYEAVITPTNLEGDGLLIPGLRSRYNLTAPNLNRKGSGVSSLNLYQDGKVRGGLAYVNSTGQLISLAFAL
ncbi:hypothetical protein [Spirosoma agri]|uniref:Lipoprotein n=1 Tax=Spirosoma agri TaxID=1987381 RepID=A0A6M0IR77_9BACT|nr:hypothetical protein [Spirosoma agri]NEU70417.1 hypothetical protein [Spirosoma agri]